MGVDGFLTLSSSKEVQVVGHGGEDIPDTGSFFIESRGLLGRIGIRIRRERR